MPNFLLVSKKQPTNSRGGSSLPSHLPQKGAVLTFLTSTVKTFLKFFKSEQDFLLNESLQQLFFSKTHTLKGNL